MNDSIAAGTERVIDGIRRVYYHGYWVRAYRAPADTLLAKKRLIEALTRRLFNHVEHGLNIPGTRLGEARRAYEAEQDPACRRVKGAMLAGALFNRATDVFTKLVELQELGVEIQPENALLVECGEHFREALELGKLVLHRSGEEGIDELWGEPLKAFSFPVEDFYKNRYIKISLAMRDIDAVCDDIISTVGPIPGFAGVDEAVRQLATAAKTKSETLRTDRDIFDVWATFAVSLERLGNFRPDPSDADTSRQQVADALALVRRGCDLIAFITRARVSMPKSRADFSDRCQEFREGIFGRPRAEPKPSP